MLHIYTSGEISVSLFYLQLSDFDAYIGAPVSNVTSLRITSALASRVIVCARLVFWCSYLLISTETCNWVKRMSRPRSRSPHYSHRGSPQRQDARRFPWDDPDFDPQQVLADLGRLPWEENRNPGESHEDQWVRFMDEIHPDGHRRHMPRGSLRPKGHRRPISPGLHRPDQLLPPEDFHHRRTPPPPHELGYAECRRLSPHDGGGGRGRVKEEFQRCEVKLPPSPQRLPRERLPSLVPQHTHYSLSHHQRAPSAGWRREERDQSQGRSRDRSPRERVQGGGKWERRGEGGDSPGSYRDRKRDHMQREWSTISDRNRRETVEPVNPGYGRETEFRERRPSLERPREGYGGRGPLGRSGPLGGHDGRGPRTLIVEHEHGIMNSGEPEPYYNHRGRCPDRNRSHSHDRFSHHNRVGASEERFRKSGSRSNTREETRGRPAHEERGPVHEERRGPIHESKRGPVHEDRKGPIHESKKSPNRQGRARPLGFQDRGSPTDPKARNGAFCGAREAPARGGKRQVGPSRNQPQPLLQGQQGYQPRDANSQHTPLEHQRYQPRGDDWDMEPREEEPDWAEESDMEPRWEQDRGPGPRGGRPPARARLGPRKPQLRDLNPNWNQQQNDMAMPRIGTGKEETLTIKVDMKRTMGQNSQLCYSSDRQLSLDLVNVGRQRLDFLPMLEHSGTYRESTMHSGTFAQEIITLVHQVKEHYFRGDSVMLTERFCGAQDGGLPEEEQEEERPTLNRRFNMSMSEPDMEPLFSKVGRMQKQQQAVSDPGDLRHDLERRRQERLEGVKVTIPGGRLSQRPLVAGSDHHEEYGSEEEEVQEEEEGFSSGWPGLPQRGGRWPGEMRRGGIVRQNMGGQRRNNRSPNLPGNHPGPMRQQNRDINGRRS
ncbi:BCLAF1 and THRAP3 family member 3 isoform X4 [Salvelinus sp. IW2-2015]|uniref:BCLAF1 and THRAP3 family member 3 isoform X4 n=1 Tax=Salvelinus sp. IW2-2015 TaxID=2691554 RepID=UPI0038D460DB